MSNVANLTTRRKTTRQQNAVDNQVSLHGNLSVVSVPDLIQWLCCANQDWEVHLWGKAWEAELIVVAGELVDARISGLRGMPALVEIIGCHEGLFELLPVFAVIERSLRGPWQNLVLAAVQQLDERNGDRAARPPITENQWFELPEEETPPVIIMLPSGHNPPDNDNATFVSDLIDEGFSALRQGNVHGAKDRWSRALSLNPGHRGLRFNLRKLEEKLPPEKPYSR